MRNNQDKRLIRQLSGIDVFCIAAGAMISSGLFILPGLAIPHMTIDGEHKFELVIARCEAGINFTQDLPPVYAAFVLVGSRDERNFHLRALSAIAQDANFDKDWLRAKNIEELRDIILLARRHRERA
ncbi:hypothetical protein ES706_06405 [subsurface metagenome]